MRRAALALLLAGVLGGASARAQDEATAPEVVRTKKGFSVNVTGVTLPHALNALGKEAGFTVVDAGRDHPQVTLNLDDAPLDVTLERLLRGANFILVYRSGEKGAQVKPGGIDKVILLSAAGEAKPAAKPAAAGGSPLAGPHSQAASHAKAAPRGAPPAAAPPGAAHRQPGTQPQPAPPMPSAAAMGPSVPQLGERIEDAAANPDSPTGGFQDPTAGNIIPETDESLEEE